MDTTIDDLKKCAKDLREVQALLPNNLEPSIAALLEGVIQRLERCELVVDDRAARLTLIDDGLRLLGHLADLIRFFQE